MSHSTCTRRGPIAEALIGVWTLRSFSDRTEGLPLQYPFGHDPEGVLIYTPDGYVSALLMARGRPKLNGNGFTGGTSDQCKLVGMGFIGYSGVYEVDELKAVVTHRPMVAFAPNMIESVQQRHVNLTGDLLVLTAEHAHSAGAPPAVSRLEWARVTAAQPKREQ